MKICRTENTHYYAGFTYADFRELSQLTNIFNMRKIHIFMNTKDDIDVTALSHILWIADWYSLNHYVKCNVIIHTMGSKNNIDYIKSITSSRGYMSKYHIDNSKQFKADIQSGYLEAYVSEYDEVPFIMIHAKNKDIVMKPKNTMFGE